MQLSQPRSVIHQAITNFIIFSPFKLKIQSSQRNTLHPCAHELHMGCTTGELALSDELHPSLKP